MEQFRTTSELPSPEPVSAELVEPRPWGPWATLGWGLLAAVVWFSVQMAIVVVFVAVAFARDPKQDMEALSIELEHNGLLLSVATLLAAPAALAMCAGAAWLRRYPVLEYLAVVRFSGRDLAIALLCLALFIPVSDGLMYLSGRPIVPEFMVDAWHTAGFLPLLVVALVVAAPLGEELFFRGFLFRGWSQSRLGPLGAILITSLLWAVIHLQYDWFEVSHIVAAGFLLGWLRWRSGSALLTVIVHGLMNLVATLEAAVQIELLG